MIPILLLAGWLAGRQLTTDGYASDEVASLIVAGGAHYGPYTPIEAWQRVAQRSPDQAMGLALMLSTWGRLVGWTEFATRALAFFGGLLALAWVYRTGRDLFSPRVGLIAACVLATSVFFITYMHIIRIFTFVALAITLMLWSYWRVALYPARPGRWSQAGLIVGAIGLFYTHYFATPFLLAIGSYHLLFVRKNRRWWRPVILFALSTLAFLPELSVFVQGLQRNLGDSQLRAKSLSIGEGVSHLTYFFTNGIVSLNPDVALAALVVSICGLLLFGWRNHLSEIAKQISQSRVVRRRESQSLPSVSNQPVFVLSFATVTLLLLILVANLQVQVISAERIRYLMPLWTLLALLLGIGLVHLVGRYPPLMWGIVTLWMLVGVGRNLQGELQYQFDVLPRNPMHHLRETLLQQASQDDLMLIDGFWYGNGLPRDFYTTYDLDFMRQLLYPDDIPNTTLTGDYNRVWFLAEDESSPTYAPFKAALESRYYHCGRVFDDPLVTLDLYVRAAAYCIGDAVMLTFGDGIALRQLAPLSIVGGRLLIDMGWSLEADVPADTYSVAVHLYDPATGDFVAQADAGLSAPPVVVIHREIGLASVPSGDYEVRVTVYNWQTGERLTGVNIQSGDQGDLLSVGQIQVD